MCLIKFIKREQIYKTIDRAGKLIKNVCKIKIFSHIKKNKKELEMYKFVQSMKRDDCSTVTVFDKSVESVHV